jgi:mono/diheme cytochrome c family protein
VGRPVLGLVAALAALGLLGSGLAWLLDVPRPAPGASREERIYLLTCATCHGADGRGSWRAWLFFLRPGDLSDRARLAQHSDQYLFDIIKHGGAPLGRPGMPGFGYHLGDADIHGLVRYLRQLAERQGALRERARSGG